MNRVLSPAATLQSPASIAQLGVPDIPALGFARAGPGPSMAGRPAQSTTSRSTTAHGFTPVSAYPQTPPQNAPASHPSNKHPAHTFTTSMRNAETRYNPLGATRLATSQRAPNPATTLPNNALLASQMEAPSRLGRASRVAFAPGPQPIAQSTSVTPQPYNPPPPVRSPRSQPHPGPSSGTPMSASYYPYQPASLSPSTSTMATLVPPTAFNNLHRRTPPPPRLNLQQSTIPRPPTAASTGSNRQAVYIDSPIDFYSSLNSTVPVQTSAYEQSPQSSAPAKVLFSVQTPDITPTHNQSFETQRQSSSFVHPQRQLPAPRPQVQVQQPRHEPSVRMCVVCFESAPAVRFAERSPTGDCLHGASVCANCLESHILIAIHHDQNTDVRCPHAGCGKSLDYRDVYASVRDWGNLAFYEYLLLKKEAEGIEEFVWCKNPSCNNGQVHTAGKSSPQVTCKACGAKSCFNHNRPWHTNLTCEQFDKVRRDEMENRATDRYLAQNTKQCPKCYRNIERSGGCDHMVCRPPGGCGAEFCWECLNDYADHKLDCSHHSPPRRRRRR